jgi:putative oxidoreductase
MPETQSRLSALALLFLRASFGLNMAYLHGWGKLQTLLGDPQGFADPLGIGWKNSLMGAVSGEFLCPILLALGFASRIAAAGMAFTMGVAAFVVHGPNPWKNKELALVYFIPAVYLMLTGPGRFSIDALLVPRLRALFGRGK